MGLIPPVVIELNECKRHGFKALSIRARHDDSGSTRIVGGKCCGQWTTVHTWPIHDIEEVIRVLQDAEEDEAGIIAGLAEKEKSG